MLLLKGGCRDTASFFNLSTENNLKHRVYINFEYPKTTCTRSHDQVHVYNLLK